MINNAWAVFNDCPASSPVGAVCNSNCNPTLSTYDNPSWGTASATCTVNGWQFEGNCSTLGTLLMQNLV